MAVDAGGVGGGTSTSGGGTSTKSSSSSKGSGKSDSFGKAMAQASNKSEGSGSTNRGDDKKSSATPEPRPAATPTASPTSTPVPGADQPKAGDDKKKEDNNDPNSVVVARSGARARNTYIEAQTQKVQKAVEKAPLTPYSGDVYRHVETKYAPTYNDAHYSPPGRYNRTGQPTLYTSESMKGLELEASRYPGKNDPSGLAGRTATTSQFTGDVIDATRLSNVTNGALTEGYGQDGSQRSRLSRITGEDPYTHPRTLGDAARAQGADAVRVPAGEGAVHVGILPENLGDPAGQLQYRSHVDIDASGVRGPVQKTPEAIKPPPAASTPNIHDPASPDYNSDATNKVRLRDADDHSRAGGVRYGAAAGLFTSGVNAVRDGELTTSDAVNVAAGTTFGAGAAVADDVLTKGFGGGLSGGIKAGGIVDGVVSAGTSVYSNAGAYGRGEISAADATADVIVDTGVGVTSGLAGAAAGAAIGSVFPVAGTAVGAAVGFGVGMVTSYLASETLEKTGAADWAREGLGDALEDNKEGMLESAWGKVSGWFN